jgi:hypothetical protein
VLEIVWVGGPWSLVVEGFLCVGIVFIEGISLGIEDAYRVLELYAGTLVNLQAGCHMCMDVLTPGLLGSLHFGWMGMERTVEG